MVTAKILGKSVHRVTGNIYLTYKLCIVKPFI